MWNKRTESFRDEPTRSAGSGGARSPGAEINHPSLPKTLSPAAKPSPGIFFILISLQLHGMVLNIVASITFFLFTNVSWIFDIYLLQVTAVVKYWIGGPDPLDYISMFANPGSTYFITPLSWNHAHFHSNNNPGTADSAPHWHYVSCGLTDLHGDARVHPPATSPEDASGYGFELTFRLYQHSILLLFSFLHFLDWNESQIRTSLQHGLQLSSTR